MNNELSMEDRWEQSNGDIIVEKPKKDFSIAIYLDSDKQGDNDEL